MVMYMWNPTSLVGTLFAVAVMHGHGDILEKGYEVPKDPADAKTHAEHGKVIHSALILGLAGGTAILKVVKYDSTRDGAQAWADLIEWYEGQGSMEAIAKRAMETLQTLQLTRGTRFGAEGYISRFEQAIQDLQETNHEYDEVMKKITFLSGIRDPQYENLMAILKLDNTRSYEQCVMEVRRCAIDIESTRLTTTNNNNGGATSRGGTRNGYRGIQRRANRTTEVGQQTVPGGYIAADVWSSMSAAERSDVIRRRANGPRGSTSNNEQQQRRNENRNGGERTDRRGGNLPRQYAGNANRTTDRTNVSRPNNGRNVSTGDNPVLRARNVVSARANVTRGRVSHVTRSALGYQMPTRHAKTFKGHVSNVTMDEWDTKSMLICDSASDVFLAGKGCRTLRYHPDTFNLKGYNDETKEDTRVPMVDVVTVVEDRQGRISMVGIRQAAGMPDNTASLLPIYELRENSWVVDDTSFKHGGTQSMSRPLNLAPNGGVPGTEEKRKGIEKLEFSTDGRFLGLRIRLDLVEALDLSGDPDDPSFKNPQYSFHWINEWKDLTQSNRRNSRHEKPCLNSSRVQTNKLSALAEAASKMDSDEEDLFYYGTSDDEETCDPSDVEICILQDDDTASEETVNHETQYLGFDIEDDDYESWDSDHEDNEEDGSQIHEDGSQICPINVDNVMVAANMDDTHTSTNSFFILSLTTYVLLTKTSRQGGWG